MHLKSLCRPERAPRLAHHRHARRADVRAVGEAEEGEGPAPLQICHRERLARVRLEGEGRDLDAAVPGIGDVPAGVGERAVLVGFVADGEFHGGSVARRSVGARIC